MRILDSLQKAFELNLTEARSVLFGFIALLLVPIIILTASWITDVNDPIVEFEAYENSGQFLKPRTTKVYTTTSKKPSKGKPKSPVLSLFDPNTVSSQELQKIGFSSYAANNLIKFREKGKVYKYKEDLAKVYGIDEGFYTKIESYIQLPSKEDYLSNSTATLYEGSANTPDVKQVKVAQPFEREDFSFDINTASEEDLTHVYGIGQVFAKRILKYRDGLGGFYSVNQLKNVYGLADSTFQELSKHVLVETPPRKIDLNTIDIENWKGSLISYRKKRSILAYRRQHGYFTEFNDLKKLHSLTENDLEAMKPYVKFSTPTQDE
ncbi:helix-hairpin-helix domain-containing protein [Jiulongibacter sp. NS-SX5]|uniref:helix-hairpin-helix domain-containing protein n=1 Tax=Jiulongibacter sp. NS-SX5 TaxID=3463854 RepID=UPI004057F057